MARLSRCASITTGADGKMPRSKPFKYTYEKEIVMYAHFKNLDYFSTECIYSPNAYRGYARTFLKDLEAVRPSAILDIIHSAEQLHFAETTKMPTQGTCKRCGYIASNDLCKACVLLEGLARGRPKMALGNERKRRDWATPVVPDGGAAAGGGSSAPASGDGGRAASSARASAGRPAQAFADSF